jgi:hypothetical protein
MATSNQPDNQSLYDVHLFPVIRLKVSGIAAASHREAIEKACAATVPDLYQRYETKDGDFAEEISHFLVDVVGDEQFECSRFYYSQTDPLVSNLARLITWYENGADGEELERIIADAREVLETSV